MSTERISSGMVTSLVGGFVLGLAWAGVARGFMRLFSDEPEFSWTGTLFIAGLSVALFSGLGLVRGARSAGRSRFWLLVPVPGLMLLVGPGLLLLPAALGGLAAGRTRRPVLRRSWVGLGALGAVLPVAGFMLTGESAPTGLHFLGLLPYAGCAATLGLAMTWWSAPWRSAGSGPEATEPDRSGTGSHDAQTGAASRLEPAGGA